jgi:DNA polymerase-3 subunit delta'
VALLNRYRPSLAPADVTALARLADGSVGRALELEEEGGVELFGDLLTLLGDLPRLSILKLHALADKALRGDAFRILSELLAWWLARLVVAQTGVTEAPPGESELVARLHAAAPPAAWAEAWSAITQLAAQADGLNLDRKRTLMNMLAKLEATAQGRAA